MHYSPMINKALFYPWWQTELRSGDEEMWMKSHNKYKARSLLLMKIQKNLLFAHWTHIIVRS